MKTFILLTFGFLGFAFYEMSGGSEFQPASERYAEATPQAPKSQAEPKVAARPSVTETATQTASISKIDSTPAVTRVALNLTSLSDTVNETPQPQPSTARVIDSSETPQIIPSIHKRMTKF